MNSSFVYLERIEELIHLTIHVPIELVQPVHEIKLVGQVQELK